MITAAHVAANYVGVRSLRLCSLNAQRARLLLEAFDARAPLDRASIARREALFRSPFRAPAVRLGARLGHGGAAAPAARALREQLAEPSGGGGAAAGRAPAAYALWPDERATGRGSVRVYLSAGATPRDELRAFVHAHLVLRGADVSAARAELDGYLARFERELEAHGWDTDEVHLGAGRARYTWRLEASAHEAWPEAEDGRTKSA